MAMLTNRNPKKQWLPLAKWHHHLFTMFLNILRIVEYIQKKHVSEEIIDDHCDDLKSMILEISEEHAISNTDFFPIHWYHLSLGNARKDNKPETAITLSLKDIKKLRGINEKLWSLREMMSEDEMHLQEACHNLESAMKDFEEFINIEAEHEAYRVLKQFVDKETRPGGKLDNLLYRPPGGLMVKRIM